MQNVVYISALKEYSPFCNIVDEDYNYISEDCLYLSVYTSNPNECANMPVRDFLCYSFWN